jgi:large subunit ribosomal protein L10
MTAGASQALNSLPRWRLLRIHSSFNASLLAEIWRVFARHWLRGKDFFLKGGEETLAITKEHKNELITRYVEWVKNSRALVLTQYVGLTMKDIDVLRSKVRENGGEFHIIKNTLAKRAFEQAGYSVQEDLLEGSTAIVFAFTDAPATVKAVTEFAKGSDFLKIKGGFLEQQALTPDSIKALAELPPLPIVRGQLLGTLLAPASKLVRTLAEPGRMIAAVLQAHAEPDASPA